jgi:signal transduction histidine kinase
MVMRWTIAAACLSTFVVGVVILAATPGFERLPPGGRAVPYLGIMLSWGFVAVGSYAWLRRPDNRTGALMTVLGVGVAATGLSLFDVPALWATGAIADTVIVSLLVHLLLAFPSGRLDSRAARVVVAMAYAAGALQPALVLFRRCMEAGCPDNPILITDDPAIADMIAGVQAVFAVVSVTLTVVLLLRRWRASSPAQRRGLGPVLLLGAVIMVLGLATAATQIAGVAPKTQIAFIAAFALFPAAFLLGLLRTRFFRTTTIARLIEQLTRDPRSVRDALAAALADPTLEVAYWLPDRGYVDREGHALPPPGEGRVLTEIDHKDGRVGALVHAAAVTETPELLGDASAAAALALENARLEVELRARLEALRASRARLVEAGDAERRRLGRDLHDGAQQRLVALMIELQLARERFADDPAGARELVDSAFANAQAAVGELRDLASGIHPAVLSQRGLDAALESLASRAPVPVELASGLPGRLPIAVETAAYFVVAEALTNVAKYAEASHARVEVRRENGCAVVDVRDDGVGGADAAGGSGLRGLGDRVGALDGTLEVESPPGAGTLVRARIPL